MGLLSMPIGQQPLPQERQPKHRQVQALRTRVRILREAMNVARLDYLRAQLELRELQGQTDAADRITRQIRNLVNAERPRTARKAKRKD